MKTDENPNIEGGGSNVSRRAVLRSAAWAAPAVVLATSAPSLAASPPILDPDQAAWWSVFSPYTSPDTRTFAIRLQVHLGGPAVQAPLTIAATVSLEVALSETFSDPIILQAVPVTAELESGGWWAMAENLFSYQLSQAEWDEFFGEDTQAATVYWRTTVGNVNLTPSDGNSALVQKRIQPTDEPNPQVGTATVNNTGDD